ncbi:MAG TPA: hypothetical protein PLB73_16665 [Leptospiraceae bacterium]|nr:hypothetical protein [Leptospiraceae bacterium]
MIHTLPSELQDLMSDSEKAGSLYAKTMSHDTAGNDLRLRVAEIYGTYEQMRERTEIMAASFLSDCYYGDRPARGAWLADITDFRSILCIGHDTEHSPICIDFAHGAKVILWDGYAWREVAPGFAGFLRLFVG